MTQAGWGVFREFKHFRPVSSLATVPNLIATNPFVVLIRDSDRHCLPLSANNRLNERLSTSAARESPRINFRERAADRSGFQSNTPNCDANHRFAEPIA